MYLVAQARHLYTTPVDITNWVQLVLADGSDTAITGNRIPYNTNRVVLNDTSGRMMEIGIGATGAQVSVGRFGPDESELPLQLCAGQEVWIRAIDGTANEGQLIASFYKGKRG
jgi:hypothetical protein